MEKVKWGVFLAVVVLAATMIVHPGGWTHAQYTPPSGGSGGTCAGLGGDVTGTCATSTVVKIQNTAVSGVQGTGTNPKLMAAGAILPVIGAVFCQDSNGLVTTASCAAGTTNQNLREVGYHFDGGGSALTGTTTYCTQVLVTGTILGWYIDADESGSATFGVRSVTFGSYTGIAGYAGYTDVTGGGTAPVLSSAVTATYSSLTSWVTSVNATDEYCFQLSSPTSVKWVNIRVKFAAL